MVPAESVAWTVNVWLPRANEAYVWLVGFRQELKDAPSSWHCTLATASLTENVKLAEVWVVGLTGFDEAAIVTAIATGSRTIADTVPVIVGPPVCNA